MNDQPNIPNEQDDFTAAGLSAESAGQQPAQPAAPAPARKGPLWKYILTVLVTMLLTGTLTIGIGLAVLKAADAGAVKSISDGRLSLSFVNDADTQKALNKLQTVYQAVDQQFYKDLTDSEMIEAMTRGLVDELGNRYTMYLTAEENQQIEESMSGNYTGIGAFVALNQEGLVEITEVIAGSPAEEAGLQIGDLFVSVDGTDVTAMKDISSVAALVRGEEGSTVDLVLYRPSLSGNIDIKATRKKITTASVSHKMLTDKIGYVQIREFSENVSKNFMAAMEDLKSQGAENIVFDLRNDTGGMANEVISMLDYLLPEGVIASLEGRSDGKPFKEVWESKASMGVPETMRYAILINGMSASASELFSGCLRDHGKAYLIGEQSFGKGSGTITLPLDDGSAINLTNFQYYLPGGDCIEGTGLAPQLAVSLPEEAQGISLNRLTLEQDTQLSAAVDYLKSLEQ
ncbi:MAG: S41 family peptidase [Clostridiaceae bacterium]|nr:S41 family peptidase [Clostridiaceae bacterium]